MRKRRTEKKPQGFKKNRRSKRSRSPSYGGQGKAYLLTEHWKTLIYTLAREDERCEICGTPHWHMTKKGEKKLVRAFAWHHRHYRTLGAETREDLMRLCKRCHMMCHRILQMKEDCQMVSDLKAVVKQHFFYEPSKRGK
jgi:hypothetical protein